MQRIPDAQSTVDAVGTWSSYGSISGYTVGWRYLTIRIERCNLRRGRTAVIANEFGSRGSLRRRLHVCVDCIERELDILIAGHVLGDIRNVEIGIEKEK